jgi:hypothetical protein
MRLLPLLFAWLLLLAAQPARAQELPNEGQSEAAYLEMLAKPAFAARVDAFEAWLRAKRVAGILPTWQILRTATMWRECAGPPFEVPPRKYWRRVGDTLRFVRDHLVRFIGPVEAVSGYRNPDLNRCAHGAANSAHRDYSALDLVPLKTLTRRQIFYRACALHHWKGRASRVGLGFYAFTRFHIDTRSFRRWGSAGPAGNESPCAVIDRGGDPEAPPLPPPPPVPQPMPVPTPDPPPAAASPTPRPAAPAEEVPPAPAQNPSTAASR